MIRGQINGHKKNMNQIMRGNKFNDQLNYVYYVI